MPSFRLSEYGRAQRPFLHKALPLRIFSMEELVCYMEENIYLLDECWIGEELIEWMKKDPNMRGLGGELERIYARDKDPYALAEPIFKLSGCLSREEEAYVCGLIGQLRGKSRTQRRKICGDHLLDREKYRHAAYIYLELLEKESAAEMTEELKGKIMHNLGVAYARMFYFEEAAAAFAGAWRISKRDDSMEAYLFALNFVPDDFILEEGEPAVSLGRMKEAIRKLDEVAADAAYEKKRRKLSDALSAMDWPFRLKELENKWHSEYANMMSIE